MPPSTISKKAFLIFLFLYLAFILFPFGACINSASPSFSIKGGTYISKLPLSPFFKPYQPATEFFELVIRNY